MTTAVTTTPPMVRDLSAVFTPGANHFELMRHAFASMVLVDHAFVLSGFGHALRDSSFQTSLGQLGVACFFVLSGGLVAASRDHCQSGAEFFRNRALRIFPAYIACLLVSAFALVPLGALAEADSVQSAAHAYWSAPGPVSYVLRNALLVQAQGQIGLVFATHPEAGAVNGSLWSIPWEATCYLMVGVLGFGNGLSRRRWLVLAALLLALGNAWLAPRGSIAGLFYLSERVVLLPVYFLLGMSCYLFRETLVAGRGLGLAAALGFIGAAHVDMVLAAPLLAYALFSLGAKPTEPSMPTARPTEDLSYGIYIFGFPVQQILVAMEVPSYGAPAMVAASFALVLPLAWLSWRAIEAPALARKRTALSRP